MDNSTCNLFGEESTLGKHTYETWDQVCYVDEEEYGHRLNIRTLLTGIVFTTRLCENILRSTWQGVLNFRIRDGILLIRYVAVKIASPQKCFETLLANRIERATSRRCMFFLLLFHSVEVYLYINFDE